MPDSCKFDGCNRDIRTDDLCNTHYQQMRTRGYLTPIKERSPRPSDGCLVENCDNPHKARGMCSRHYRHWLAGTKPEDIRQYGGGSISTNGYRTVRKPDHPAADKRGRVYEHRVIMEDILGRHLRPGENVHHKNGLRADNRPENLELWLTRQPTGQRISDLLEWAHWLIDTYEENDRATEEQQGS